MEMKKTGKERVSEVLKRKDPGRFVYAPNYWQWFAHQKNHGLLPEEISSCNSQLDLIQYLGLDVFSRNIYSDQQGFWFGGFIHLDWDGIRVETDTQMDSHDTIVKKNVSHPVRYPDRTFKISVSGIHAGSGEISC